MQTKFYNILVVFFFIFNAHSQINFKKGYYITNNGEKIECFIKDSDSKNNPTKFEYKILEDSEVKTNTILNVQEFGIIDLLKFKRFTVKIDRSDVLSNNLNQDRNPIFKEETLFLKVLVEGKATLFSFVDEYVYRYFYNVDNSIVEQLVFKTYSNHNGYTVKNNFFRQQLFSNLKCNAITERNVLALDYNREDLVGYFLKYNNCSNTTVVNYEEKEKRKFFNFSIKAGISSSSLSTNHSVYNDTDTDFGNKLSLVLGLEAEAILPIKRNKWSLLLSPTYRYYKGKTDVNSQAAPELRFSTVDYKTVDLSLGIRHYMFLNENSKLFVNGSYVFSFPLKDEINSMAERKVYELGAKTNIDLGIGYSYLDRYSVELRFGLKRNVLTEYANWDSNYSSTSLIFGYRIF